MTDYRDSTNEDLLEKSIPQPANRETWQPEYKFKKLFFKECAIAGICFHIDRYDDLWTELEIGTKLALVRDKNNSHDPNAVAVALAGDYDEDASEDFDFDFILGYVPRSENIELAAMMDAGYAPKLSAEVSTLKRHGNINDRIRITIFIQSLEPEIVRPDLFRGHSISTSELNRMVRELSENGMTYFRFGGFPHYDLQYPEVGEKIVMVHRDEHCEVLFLMHVLASSQECLSYPITSESLDCVDDCVPFILTNIMGPIRIHKSDWPFLSGVDLCGFDATTYLPGKITDGFRDIFKSQLNDIININNIDMDPSIDG